MIDFYQQIENYLEDKIMANISINIHVRSTTEMKTGRALAAHAWLQIGDATLFMGYSPEEELEVIDHLSAMLAQLRQERVELSKTIKEAWKLSEAARM